MPFYFFTYLFIIVFFMYLFVFHFLHKNGVIEGLSGTYENYDDDPLILAKKNAANIQFIKEKIDKLDKIPSIVKNNTIDINKNSKAINSLMQSMSPVSEIDVKENENIIKKNKTSFNV